MGNLRRMKEKFSDRIGLYMQDIDCNIPNHWHEHYEITLCTEGEGYSIVNGESYHLKKRVVCCFLTPSDFHNIDIVSPLKLTVLTFSVSFFPYSYLTEMLYSVTCSYIDLSDDEFNDFLFYINKLKREKNLNNQYSSHYIKNIFSCILLDLFRHTEINTKASYPTYITKIIYYINCHFKEQISLKDVADFSGISYSNIGKYIKKYLNVSFREYLNNIRLEYSCLLLINSAESISDVAEFSGFTSLSHYSNIFKAKYGITPYQYRNRNIGEKN